VRTFAQSISPSTEQLRFLLQTGVPRSTLIAMGDDEDLKAEERAYARRFPFMIVGGLILLLSFGLFGAGLDKWPYALGGVTVGAALIAFGEWRARRV
jgi:hypothetical protein